MQGDLCTILMLIFRTSGLQNIGGVETVSLIGEMSPELHVIGKLESIEKTPGCGIIYYGAISKYKDLTIIKGKYTAKELFVVHGCPEMSREGVLAGNGNLKKFVVGEFHELYLSKKNIHKIEVIVGAEGIPKEAIYFCKVANLKK